MIWAKKEQQITGDDVERSLWNVVSGVKD